MPTLSGTDRGNSGDTLVTSIEQDMSSAIPTYQQVPSYEDFRERAQDSNLSLNEKCGFPDAFRSGQSAQIYADICSKLTVLCKPGVNVLDIGPGCSELAHFIIERTGFNNQSLTVIDSPEMLSLLPEKSHLTKIEGPFPDCIQKSEQTLRPFDAILAYSVAQTVFKHSNIFAFIDCAVHLLNEQGQFLIGDIPNVTMRKRFMITASGRAYHKIHYPHLPQPEILPNLLEPGQIDDGVVLGIIARMRGAGLHAFLLPQPADLPHGNRREDILIKKP
jgi:hypothetical protein